MDKNIDLYLKNQTEEAKLIYTVGILWSQISTRLENVLAKFNLNIAKFNILMIIKHAGGKDGIQQNEISKHLLVTASNITKLLDKLEKDGMITRNNKENDRRVKLIMITKSASDLLDKAWKIYQKEVKSITAKMPEKEAKELNKKILEWLTNIK
jgi:DNA-binding MarR family transcriptional regulator